MPIFGPPFSGLAKEKKVSREMLARAIRFMVAAEYEATQMYMPFAIKVLMEIDNEERVHAREFQRRLHELAPVEAKLYEQGAKEVEEEIEA